MDSLVIKCLVEIWKTYNNVEHCIKLVTPGKAFINGCCRNISNGQSNCLAVCAHQVQLHLEFCIRREFEFGFWFVLLFQYFYLKVDMENINKLKVLNFNKLSDHDKFEPTQLIEFINNIKATWKIFIEWSVTFMLKFLSHLLTNNSWLYNF